MADSNNSKFILGSLAVIVSLLLLTQVILYNAWSLGENMLSDPHSSEQSRQLIVSEDIKPGEKIVQSVCKRCHAFGMMRAPKLGSERDWAPRIEKGKAVLYDHALNGFNRMPARGDRDLSDEEVKAAVDYMLSLLDFDTNK